MTLSDAIPRFLDVEAVDQALSSNRTLPTSWYWDSEAFDFELENLFGRSWHLAGPIESLREPGDHIVAQAGRVPVVVVRDKAGELRGFVNACRHRGYEVAHESGRRSTLQCRYHGWTYDLDGKLRAAPQCPAGEFEGSELALLPVAVDAWHNLVFVNPDPEACRLLDHFPELDTIASRWSMDFTEDYAYSGVSRFEIEGNWKGWCENTNECYHCPTIHKNTYHATFKSLKDREVLITDNLIGAINSYREQSDLLGRHGMSPSFGERYLYLFPGTFISKDDYLCFAGYTVPVEPERTEFVSHTWLRKGLDETFLADWMEMWDQTLKEDTDAVRIQQRGYRSRQLPYGQLSAEADTMIIKFHELVWQAYRRVIGTDSFDPQVAA